MSVTQFPGKQEVSYWRCNCGCLTCFARSDGDLECANTECRAIHENNGDWRIPERSEPRPRAKDETDTKIVDLSHPRAAKHRMKALADDESVLAIVIIRDTGVTNTWGIDFETDEQKAWVRSNLDAAYDELTRKLKPEGT